MSQPASLPSISFAQLSGLKEAHMAFRDALFPIVLTFIAPTVQERLFRPVGENSEYDRIHRTLAIHAFNVVDDPTDAQMAAYRQEADAHIAKMHAEGPDGPIHRKLLAFAAELVAEALKAAWIQAHKGEEDFSDEMLKMTFFGTERAFGRLADLWLHRGPFDDATGIPIHYICSIGHAIAIFAEARAALPADQVLPPGGAKLLEVSRS